MKLTILWLNLSYVKVLEFMFKLHKQICISFYFYIYCRSFRYLNDGQSSHNILVYSSYFVWANHQNNRRFDFKYFNQDDAQDDATVGLHFI